MRWLKWLGARQSVISEEEAVNLARELCEQDGLQWSEPIRVRKRGGRWGVWTNAEKIGGNVEIIVNARSGSARRSWGPVSR